MALKLFRSTGYESILMAGETSRLAMHPGWLVLAVSLWIGFVANVALWRELAGTDRSHGLAQVLAIGVVMAGAAGTVLSLLGWRKTIKPAATLLLIAAALLASSIWSQALPLDATLFSRKPSSLLLLPWASFLRWQVLATLAGLALVPAVWVWQQRIRRLAGPQQLRANLAGAAIGATVAAASGWLLAGGL